MKVLKIEDCMTCPFHNYNMEGEHYCTRRIKAKRLPQHINSEEVAGLGKGYRLDECIPNNCPLDNY